MNYTNEYTVNLTVLVSYRPNCDNSVESENFRPINVIVKLRPLGKLTIRNDDKAGATIAIITT